MNPVDFSPAHFRWDYADGVATVTLNRPERKNPLTFESYAELRDTFRALVYTPAVKAVVIAGAGANWLMDAEGRFDSQLLQWHDAADARFAALVEEYGSLLRGAIAQHCPRDLGIQIEERSGVLPMSVLRDVKVSRGRRRAT